VTDRDGTQRPGETTMDLPAATDVGLFFIGRLRTPWPDRAQCPKRGDAEAGPVCRVEVDARWRDALVGIDRLDRAELLYWMHLARRDLVLQNPQGRGALFGTFALRSPMRPNPVSSSVVALLGCEGESLLVRGLDCVDGTPLIDIKPVHCPMWTGVSRSSHTG
jgi:tRNA (adenine37-N6)-methyltransferase